MSVRHSRNKLNVLSLIPAYTHAYIHRHGHIEVQKYLRARGGRLIIDPFTLGTTLCEAAATGDIQKIKILYENGADINQGKVVTSLALVG